jgi:CheY-like chemotaxis protein/CHASE3 domain sensor protein/putative methionine-R-sulfoxide reductase with GAF domain
MRFTLNTKILLGFAVCSAVLMAVAIFSFRNSAQFIETNQLVNHTHEVLYELEQILAGTVSAEAGARGYVITGNESYLEPFDSAKRSVYAHVDKTKQLTKSNSEVQRIIGEVEILINLRFANLVKFTEARKTAGFAEAKAIIDLGEGKRLQSQIKALIGRVRMIEETLLTKRKQASEEDASNFNVIFIILLIVIAITLVAVYIIITTNLRALKKAEAETANKNWTLAGSAELVKSMQGNKQLQEVSQVIINHLATYLNAQTGVIYVTEEDNINLRVSGTYAFDRGKTNSLYVRFGEGIVGQSAEDKKPILITEIPDNYSVIDTGFGKVLPKNILAVPFIFENKVAGVIELGTAYEFTTLQKEYLQLVLDSIAIAVTSAQGREKTKELLEETQRQSEELQVQQEELKQANDELHAKTEMLERSESELKTQQSELQQVNIELEEKANMLEEQKKSLEDAKTEIERKASEIEVTSRYKSEFLANMSHELRTPLNSILILAQLLSENKNNRLGEKEVEYSRNIYNSGGDLLNLINEILDLSKIEAGKMELDIADVPMENIIDNTSSMFSEIAKSKAVVLNVNISEADRALIMTTDKQRVEQILRNLLSNAFKFTDKDGTVTLSVGRPSANVRFRSKLLNTASGAVAFSVSDTGIGIPKEKQAIIFEAFQQADGSTKRKYGGTGLGLSISRELAFALGGEIHLESEEGKGSTFTLYLPQQFNLSFIGTDKRVEIKERESVKREIIKAGPAPAADRENPHAIDDRNNINENDRVILIIEDEAPFALVLLDFIRGRHYKGIIASQGNTGLSYARHYKPDAILLDIKLPVMDGTEVLKQLKNDPELRHIPVQIISSYDKKKEGLELGAFDYIGKPVTITDLQKAFDKIEKFASKKLKKLLIVEDNKAQNNAIRELIGNGDVKCFSAYLGREAYEMLTNDTFDCVIVDLGLPDMSGFELLDKIRGNEFLNKIPIVVYTGKDLKKEDNIRLSKLANTVVLKTADSHERLLDETILFLHRVESRLPKEKQKLIRSLHKTDEILKNKKILIVDDDIRNIYSLTNALEDEGLQCLTAENGKAALKILAENSTLDLILMDIMMPEMDGYETTTAIRRQDQFTKLPIIALTAKAMKGDKEKCLAVGMSDYISKPVNLEQLLSLMRVWLYR